MIAIKLPLTINSYIDGIKDKEEKEFPSTVDIFIKKTSQGYGMDDMIRGPMSVSGERKFERTDVFGLTHINEPESKEMFRLIESTNHKKFNNFNQEVEQLYWKFVNQKSLVVNATETLKNIILDSETKFDSDAASDFFNFGKQEDDDEKKGAKSTYKKKGPDSQFNLPLALFSNPKSYKIEKVEEKNLDGFKIKNENFKENCKDTIKKIDEFIEKNKDNPSLTIKLKKQLELQKIKNTEWLNDKNLDALYPSKISIYCAEDLDGKNDKDSFKLHDKFLDFDLSNKLKHTIITEKKGDISDVEVENGNHIIISVNGPEFFYKILTDAFTLSLTKDHSDLRVSATMTTYKNEKTIKLHK